MQNIILNRRSGKQVFYGLDGHFSTVALSQMLEIRSDGYVIRVSTPAGSAASASTTVNVNTNGHDTPVSTRDTWLSSKSCSWTRLRS